MKTIHVDELQERLEAGEALHVVDVREQDEYDAGHIPNVRFLPMSEIGERYTELQEGETYFLICKAAHGVKMSVVSSNNMDTTSSTSKAA